MRLDLVVPYIAQTKDAGTRSPFRIRYATTVVPVEIPEFSDGDCPVVARCEVDGRATTFRSLDGEVATIPARPDAHPDDVSWLVASAASLDFGSVRMGRAMVGTAGCMPEGDPRYLVREVMDHKEKAVSQVSLAVREMALVDGALWVKGPGPVVRLCHVPDGLFADLALPRTTDVKVHHQFRLDHAHLVEEYVRTAFPGSEIPRLPEFELYEPGLLGSFDPQAVALTLLALAAAGNDVGERRRSDLQAAARCDPPDPAVVRRAVSPKDWSRNPPMASFAKSACFAYDLVERDREARNDEASLLTF